MVVKLYDIPPPRLVKRTVFSRCAVSKKVVFCKGIANPRFPVLSLSRRWPGGVPRRGATVAVVYVAPSDRRIRTTLLPPDTHPNALKLMALLMVRIDGCALEGWVHVCTDEMRLGDDSYIFVEHYIRENRVDLRAEVTLLVGDEKRPCCNNRFSTTSIDVVASEHHVVAKARGRWAMLRFVVLCIGRTLAESRLRAAERIYAPGGSEFKRLTGFYGSM